MSARLSLAAVVFAAGAVLPRLPLPEIVARRPATARAPAASVSQAARQGAIASKGATTTLDDQTELAVTVYNSDIALVRDVRSLTLSRGTSDLRFMDIAA